MIDILLSQRFLPERGGSISLMHELYSRWPTPVHVITHNYPEVSSDALNQSSNLSVERHDILMNDWGLDSVDSLRKYIRMFFALKNLVSAEEQVRIHCTHALPEALTAAALKYFSRKCISIVTYAHGEEITACETSRQLRFLYSCALNASDKIVANSENTSKLLKRHIKKIEKIRVIYPGVTSLQKSEREDLRIAYSKTFPDSACFNLLSIGRLEPRKNHARVLIALKELKLQKPELSFHYRIAGTGSQLETIMSQIETLDLASQVSVLGDIDEHSKNILLAGSDLFISPSVPYETDFEGYGISLIEAASFGLPCIAGDSGGQPEAVLDGITGVLVSGTDSEEIAQTISNLMQNKDLRKQLSENALAHAADLCWDSRSRKVYEFITE